MRGKLTINVEMDSVCLSLEPFAVPNLFQRLFSDYICVQLFYHGRMLELQHTVRALVKCHVKAILFFNRDHGKSLRCLSLPTIPSL